MHYTNYPECSEPRDVLFDNVLFIPNRSLGLLGVINRMIS